MQQITLEDSRALLLFHKQTGHNRVMVGVLKLREVLKVFNFHSVVGKDIIYSGRIIPEVISLTEPVTTFFETIIQFSFDAAVHI